MARCIPETMRDGGAESNEQAVAICAAKWEDDKAVRNKFVSYKAADGRWRWMAVSSMAIMDREGEIVSEKAYDDAIALADRDGRGELDLVHLNGTDVGDCDTQTRLGMMLVEGGTWRDTPLARKVRQAVAADPDRWGVSIKFRYDPSQFDGRTYTGGIQIRKRSILPREMAASFGTAITTTGGDMEMTEQVKEALGAMGLDETEIEEIAERQKSVEAETHVVNKAETVLQKVRDMIGKAFGSGAEAPDAGGAENVTEVPPAEPAEPEPAPETEPEAEKATEPEAPQEPPSFVLSEDAQKAIAASVAQSMAGGVAQALQPVAEKMAQMQVTMDALVARLAEVEKTTEDRVMERLRQLPPVVKAAPTQVAATVTQDDPSTPAPEAEKTYAQALFAQVEKSLADALKGVEVKYRM
jgi:hypothetical protein